MLKERLAQDASAVDGALKELFRPEAAVPAHLQEVMAYSVMAGGKRLRPALVLETCRAFGGKQEEAMPFACAIELIHTYSLIHDDLPCIDNDTMRRGRPTSHVAFDERRALLAGDALLSYAFEVMLSGALKSDEPKRALAACADIAHAAGIRGMVAGQWQDVLSEGKQITPEELDYIHEHKTADMMRGAVLAGAHIAGAPKEALERFDEYARLIGVAFQITDDILDVTGDAKKLGKNTGSDANDGKVTYVTLYGPEKARDIACEMTARAAELVGDAADGFFRELAYFITARDN